MKYFKYIFLIVFAFSINISLIIAANFKCSIGGYQVEYNSSGEMVAVYKNGVKDPSYNGNVTYYSYVSPKSKEECPAAKYVIINSGIEHGKYYFKVEKNGASDKQASSCAEFFYENDCKAGIGKDNARFGCAWNDKYEFCSPTGLAYLSCGSGNSDAHDIPVFLPRITSYGIILLKTVTPVILIIMSMFQMIKAIASQNEDEMKKARSALIKKMIAAAMIFFITSLVQFVVKQVADSSELGSANQCLSCFVNNDCNGSMYYTDGYGHCYNVKTRAQIDNKYCSTDTGIKEGVQEG